MMGSKGGGGGNNGVPVVIPSGSRKIVQSLKEIVNCSEQEIYAALKECNMDPNEAVNRLLSQVDYCANVGIGLLSSDEEPTDFVDPFHEVKSKREKKKEVKDTTESRPRGVVASIRGGRTGVDRHAGRGRANIPSSNVISDSSKPMLKKENGAYAILTSSSSASAMSGPNINRQVASSDNFPSANKGPIIGENDLISSSVQPSPGFQHAWGGTPGHVSMADILKMGKPQVKSSGAPNHLTHHPMAPGSNDGFQLHDQSSKLYKPGPLITGQHIPSNDDDWPLNEQHALPPNEDEWPPFENSKDGSGQHVTSRLDGHIPDDGHIESSTDHMGFASVSNRNMPEDDGTDPSLYDNNVYENVNAFQPHMHAYEHNEDDNDDGVGAASTNLQHLSLQKNEQGSAPEDDGPAVVMPDHLQIHPPNCQHLSFGSFAPSIGAFSGSAGSRSFKGSLAETQPLPDDSSDLHPEIRNSEPYGDEHLRPTSNGEDTHGGVPNGGNYEAPSASQTEVLQQQHLGESAVGSQYAFPSAASAYSYETSQAMDSTFTHAQVSSPMQNLTPFSNVLPSYTNLLPSNLLASAVQTGRESDLSYLPFPATQPTATKYNNTASLNTSLTSTPEGFRAGSVSATQQAPQSLPAAGLAAGLSLPQHLAMHAYSQPALSLGPFANMANMVSYPFLPQSYSYVPSAFQQAFASNNTYHQSLAAVLPQYKNSLSASNLPQSGAVASGYGFNSSTNVPGGNFTLNPQSASTTLRYEDALSSQYKDASNLLSLQQNDNSGMWVPGAAAQTATNLQASTYYNFPGQSQQPGGLRQAQQPSQHFSILGYPNYYQSAGISLEHQQQLVRDSALGGSQGQQSKQSAQIWQNTY